MKHVTKSDEWEKVSGELEQEVLKLQSYDHILLSLLGDINGRHILDYGCGPGILASVLQGKGASVKAYDIAENMRQQCEQKIGRENVYNQSKDILDNYFHVVICNLVMCIVEDSEVKNISVNLEKAVREDGRIYIGFCNPLIFNIPESALDFRYQTSYSYGEVHDYRKTKKEGSYRIIEKHRPIGWYEVQFTNVGLRIEGIHLTQEYELNGRRIQDFVIFELSHKTKYQVYTS